MHMLAPTNHRPQLTRRVHEDTGLQKMVNPVAAPTPSLRAHPSTEIPPEALQFAPPLAAYTAGRCGADEMFLEYNSTLQSAALRGVKDMALFLPQTQKKLQMLQRVRETGYFTLRPVGIHKTMAELDRDAVAEEDEQRSAHAENLAAMMTGEQLSQYTHGTGVLEEESDLSGALGISGSGIVGSSGLLASSGVLATGMDRDLDEELVDADINDLSLQTEEADSDTPDAFMAEDVEYQNDHSLASGSVVGAGQLVGHGHGSAGSETVWNSPIATTSARILSTSSHRVLDDSDIDMTLDE